MYIHINLKPTEMSLCVTQVLYTVEWFFFSGPQDVRTDDPGCPQEVPHAGDDGLQQRRRIRGRPRQGPYRQYM